MSGVTGWIKINEDKYESSGYGPGWGYPEQRVERDGDGWRITLKDREQYTGPEVYPTYQDAMKACAPRLPVYGTEEFKKWGKVQETRKRETNRILNFDAETAIAKIHKRIDKLERKLNSANAQP